MRPFLGIVVQTLRATLRARVFLVILCLVLAAVFVLPLAGRSDDTLSGQMQLTLTYSLGVLTALISFSTIVVATACLAREIEGYQMHLVLTTSTPRWLVWLGKWVGILLIHTVLFAIGAAIIYGAVFWKLRRWDGDLERLKTLIADTRRTVSASGSGPDSAKRAAHADELTRQLVAKVEELDRLRSEVLIGRHEYLPEQPDLRQAVEAAYQRQLAAGMHGPDHNPGVIRDELLRQLKASLTDIPAGQSRAWRYRGVRAAAADRLFIRYRCYAGSTSRSEQKFVPEQWGIRNFGKEGPEWVPIQRWMVSGVFHEFNIPVELEPEPGVKLRFVSDTGEVMVGISNPPETGMSLVFQVADGPVILVPDVSFTANYARVLFLVFLQLGFLAALGCCVSAALTTPVALFVAVAYLVIGMSIQPALAAQVTDDDGTYQYHDTVNAGLHLIARGVAHVVVSVNDFDASADLSRGRLVTDRRLLVTVRDLIGMRTLLLVGLGMVFLTRRELGTVVRG